MVYYIFSKFIVVNIFLSLIVSFPLKTLALTESTSVESPSSVESESESSQQRIKDFYLTNYKEDGAQDWEVEGKEAFIYDTYVDIDQMNAKYYTKDDTVFIKSKKAKLDKKSMDVYLREDVEVENKEGTLVTDSLDWKRNQNNIKTDDWVKVNNKSIQITAKGMTADTQMSKVDFEENVEALLPDEKNKDYTMITCTGPLEIEHIKGTAVFNDNVVVENKDGTLFSDKATAFFNADEKKLIKVVSVGNVKIVKDENITLAQKATYFGEDERLLIEGNPRVIYFPDEDETP
ncbi:MAG: LPS export ABC transporter periplasmic protein LptC [Candidatus Omnitrophota bacterium]|nr:MAG: LPS export ABC transporter periplasmic protein LptC [Candidatus Omnitrophota bacterium]